MKRTGIAALLVLVAVAAYFAGSMRPSAWSQDQKTEARQSQAGEKKPDNGMPGEAVALAAADISDALSHKALQAAYEKAREIDTKMDIAIVDAGGNLKQFLRMDGAWLGSIDIAIKKAKTARYFDMPTGDIGKLSQPGGPLYNIEHSNNGLITFPGGIPLKDAQGQIIGAIGVSGSTVENDHAVAQAAADVVAAK